MTLGAIPYAVSALAILGLVFIIFGYILDVIVATDNEMMTAHDLPYSQQRAVAMGWIITAYRAMAVFATIIVVAFLIINGNQSESGEI